MSSPQPEPAPVAADVQQWAAPYAGPPPFPPGPDVRYTPTPPLGAGTQITGTQMSQFYSLLAAAGVEKARMVALMALIQEIAIKATMEATTPIIGALLEVNRAGLLRLLADINALPEITVAPTGLRAMFTAPTLNAAYLQKEHVMQLITAAIERSPKVS